MVVLIMLMLIERLKILIYPIRAPQVRLVVQRVNFLAHTKVKLGTLRLHATTSRLSFGAGCPKTAFDNVDLCI